MYSEFFTRNTRVPISSRILSEDGALPPDGYRVCVTGEGRATLSYGGGNGRRYAEQTLSRLTNGEGTLVAEIEDAPAFPMRGIVEGFYGAPYTDEQRRDAVDFLAAHRMNVYFYAPKDDAYHRDLWREPYPEEELRALSSLCRYAAERGVRMYFCLSPGKDFRYTCEEDYAVLLSKLDGMRAAGFEDFALFFDDIEPALKDGEGERFASPAAAHCAVVNFINRRLVHPRPLLFCPTDYFQKGDTPYRRTVRELLDRDVAVFWTGYNTVAEVITDADCRAARESFGHEVVLWDNYPVNDFAPKRVFLGEVCNRTRHIAERLSGYVANPSPSWETSKLALATAAELAWDPEGYDGEAAFRRAAEEVLGSGGDALFFAGLFRSSVLRREDGAAPLFAREDFSALDSYYRRAVRAAGATVKRLPASRSAEWEALRDAVFAEAALYRAFRAGKRLLRVADRVKACRYRTADCSLARYLEERGLAEGLSLPERPVYWETEAPSKSSPERTAPTEP